MRRLGEFLLSLMALPFLLPWHLAEKLFEYLVQPLIFKHYRVGLDDRKRRNLRLVIVGAGTLVLAYLAWTFYEVRQLFPSYAAFFAKGHIYFVTMANDLIRLTQALLWPVNVTLTFVQGSRVAFWHLLLALYLCFLPALFLFNLLLRIVTTTRSLGQAVTLRNQAVRDVDLVRFAEKAGPDEIFVGLDMNRNHAPFYLKRQWLKGHAQIIGAAGSGKTESIIQPIWFQEVRRNVATFVIDGKGSRRNLDRFYTIATSLAQGHEVIYFNPGDPDRSATYNPVLTGSAGEIRQKIIASLNWAEAAGGAKERTSFYLDLIIRAIKETGRFISLEEIYQYLTSKTHLHNELRKIRNRSAYEGLFEVMENYSRFQTETEFLATTLREICQSDYAWLLDTDEPEIDIAGIYLRRKDCYFTLPMHSGAPAMHFLGQLILQDMATSFARVTLNPMSDAGAGNEGLLIIDELAHFVNPGFIELLRVCRNAQVSVCYTNQSFAELSNPALHLSPAFVEELADHTNATFCFHLGSTESIRAILQRIGQGSGKSEAAPAPPPARGKPGAGSAPSAASAGGIAINEELLKHLEVGRCLAFIRQPRVLAILKTGYFKFEKPLSFEGRKSEKQVVAPSGAAG
ncbi:type IV secretory system conjugative DNA transfer family protein [bacterium]|nr:type IV secretory system conjugative DNA transfer family protein [bacterium]